MTKLKLAYLAAASVAAIALGAPAHADATADCNQAVDAQNANIAGTTECGVNSSVTATDATAIGAGSTASHVNSVAIGAGTVTTATSQVNVGGRTIGGLLDGTLADDAATVGQIEAADATLQANIDAEEAARIAADDALGRTSLPKRLREQPRTPSCRRRLMITMRSLRPKSRPTPLTLRRSKAASTAIRSTWVLARLRRPMPSPSASARPPRARARWRSAIRTWQMAPARSRSGPTIQRLVTAPWLRATSTPRPVPARWHWGIRARRTAAARWRWAMEPARRHRIGRDWHSKYRPRRNHDRLGQWRGCRSPRWRIHR